MGLNEFIKYNKKVYGVEPKITPLRSMPNPISDNPCIFISDLNNNKIIYSSVSFLYCLYYYDIYAEDFVIDNNSYTGCTGVLYFSNILDRLYILGKDEDVDLSKGIYIETYCMELDGYLAKDVFTPKRNSFQINGYLLEYDPDVQIW